MSAETPAYNKKVGADNNLEIDVKPIQNPETKFLKFRDQIFEPSKDLIATLTDKIETMKKDNAHIGENEDLIQKLENNEEVVGMIFEELCKPITGRDQDRIEKD